MASWEIAAIIFGILIIVVLVLFVILIFFRDKLPCFEKEFTIPEGPTEWPNVNKYGETSLTYITCRLSDIRARRGPKEYNFEFRAKKTIGSNREMVSEIEVPRVKTKKRRRKHRDRSKEKAKERDLQEV